MDILLDIVMHTAFLSAKRNKITSFQKGDTNIPGVVNYKNTYIHLKTKNLNSS